MSVFSSTAKNKLLQPGDGNAVSAIFYQFPVAIIFDESGFHDYQETIRQATGKQAVTMMGNQILNEKN